MTGSIDYELMRNERWSIFDSWVPVKKSEYKSDWHLFEHLLADYEHVVESKYEQLHSLLRKWDKHLRDLGGDSTHHNWTDFRPLRLTREEDWSDWLAYLFGESKTGVFAKCLLGIPHFELLDYARPKKVRREIGYGGFRADIIIQWQNNSFSHIEVKIEDENLKKTIQTSECLMKKYYQSRKNWTNFILLRYNHLVNWEGINALNNNSNTVIKAITWKDVTVALRRALLSKENVPWKVWAYSFLGSIEQRIIGFPGHRLACMPYEKIDEKIDVLRKGLDNG